MWSLKHRLVTITLPDDLAAALLPPGQEPTRAALEAIALEAYRQRRITGYQLRRLLGIESRYELDGFLKEYKVHDYTVEDFEHGLATISEIRGEAQVRADMIVVADTSPINCLITFGLTLRGCNG